MCHHESGASPPRCNCLNMHLPGVLDLGGPSVPGHGPLFSYTCDVPFLGLKSQVFPIFCLKSFTAMFAMRFLLELLVELGALFAGSDGLT